MLYTDPALILAIHCPHVAAVLIAGSLLPYAHVEMCDYFDGSTKALVSHMAQKLRQLIQTAKHCD